MNAALSDKFVIIGTIGTAFGIKGWVKVHSHTNPSENMLHYTPWYIETTTGWVDAEVIEKRAHSDAVIAHMKGCDDRDAALRLTHKQIAIKREQLSEPSQDEYYWTDLEGLTVINQHGVCLGTVECLMETGANDVMVIKGEKPCLIPFVLRKTILNVDLMKKCIQVNWDANE